ncbi:8-oxo-dGTP pyrophosphatase MutT, NUDIX family [Pontibaca methylaminivorans]|uniref:8-oxo-dGTP pyrophosphatase MutT, NUDIX family n=1 Tax=Pontibaca methylaminivorans TaxID=515897 RepID=A0A1R3WL19_9RHOB|nr:8-oxo-dGTP pyrophosphatase MutT, NUDIX family [Pontibaca methylaminivorans]
MIRQLPISLNACHKSDVRSQFAALCWRLQGDAPEILLITTRGTGRWIVPKGWPMDGMTPAASAAQEAWEEAGVIGTPAEECLGLYSYTKKVADGAAVPCLVMVYPVRVGELREDFPEKGQRRRDWFSLPEAALRVREAALAQIIGGFDPGALS